MINDDLITGDYIHYTCLLYISVAGADGDKVAIFGGALVSANDHRHAERDSRPCCHGDFTAAPGDGGAGCEERTGAQQVSATSLNSPSDINVILCHNVAILPSC